MTNKKFLRGCLDMRILLQSTIKKITKKIKDNKQQQMLRGQHMVDDALIWQ